RGDELHGGGGFIRAEVKEAVVVATDPEDVVSGGGRIYETADACSIVIGPIGGAFEDGGEIGSGGGGRVVRGGDEVIDGGSGYAEPEVTSDGLGLGGVQAEAEQEEEREWVVGGFRVRHRRG
ncbi:MAG: hypothetical protein RI897_88, partial [Verrucomicrobiota bacterium]